MSLHDREPGWLAGYQHALSVPGYDARIQLIQSSAGWSTERLRGFIVGGVEASRIELCAALRKQIGSALEYLRTLDPASPTIAEHEQNLANIDQLEREPLTCDWIECTADAN